MPKPQAATLWDVGVPGEREQATPPENQQEGVIEVTNVMGGMIDRLPRDQRPPNSWEEIVNGRTRDDWLGRRPGTAAYGAAKPNSNPIIAIVTFITESGDVYFCRFTQGGLHVADSTGNWTAYDVLDADGNPTTFTGELRRLSIAQFFNNLFIADGVNPIWFVDFSTQKIQQIEGAPTADFIATFAERIVAGSVHLPVGGIRPSTLMWPVNSDPFDWSGYGSGSEDLAATDIGDEITGLVALEDLLVVIRRRSITGVSRQPFASAPFRFTTLVNGFGSDLPYSVTRVPGGVIFGDQRTREVYFYSPGGLPSPIGARVNRGLYQDLQKLSFAQGAFDPYEKEYHLGLVIGDGEEYITKTWVLSIEYQAWSYDDSPEVSCLGVVSFPGSSISIDDLLDTIDDQTVTIDEYGTEGGIRPSLMKGTATGDVLFQSYDADHDWDATQFEFLARSQNLGSFVRRRTIKDLEASVVALNNGDVTLEESYDNATWYNTLTFSLTGGTGNQLVALRKMKLTGNDLWWRIRSTAPALQMKSWWARLLEKAAHR